MLWGLCGVIKRFFALLAAEIQTFSLGVRAHNANGCLSPRWWNSGAAAAVAAAAAWPGM